VEGYNGGTVACLGRGRMGQARFWGKIVTHRQILEQTLGRMHARLPDERVRQILDFAEFLSLHEEQTM
jgi:hypothetical protein